MDRRVCAVLAFVVIGANGAQVHTHSDGDGDGDGILDDADRCLTTPRRAEPIAVGCSTVELIAQPRLVGDPVKRALDVAAEGIGLDLSPEYTRQAEIMRRRLQQARTDLDGGLDQLSRGDLCGMADTVAGAREDIEGISRDSHALLLATRVALQRQISPTAPLDADSKEVAFHEAGYRASLVGKALLAMRAIHETAEAACRQRLRQSRFNGIVVRTEDATRIAELTGGKRLVVPVGADTRALAEGALVRAHGWILRDGTGIGMGFAPAPNDGLPFSTADTPMILPPCIRLQVAPFQPFNPPLPIPSSYVLHHPAGYTGFDDGVPVLNLEAPMRLGVALTGDCPARPSAGGKYHWLRYSAQLQYRPAGSLSFTEFASDLDHLDDPVSLPATAIPPTTFDALGGTLRVIHRVQKCLGSRRGGRGTRCSSTVKTIRTVDYKASIRHQGGFASYEYLNTLFNLEEGDPIDYDIAVVTSFTVHPSLIGYPAGFEAEGYSASGTRVIETINAANPGFAIYADDFFDPNQIASLAAVGTDQRSGLRWPRVIGSRNGWPFWYSARLPHIDRDLAQLCSPGPNSYYRLPWENGHTEDVTQGNSSPPGESHAAGDSQEFAFDFGLSEGTSIRAARGGTVEWLTENLSLNIDPDEGQPVDEQNQPLPPGSPLFWGNAVRITHQDGTTSWYFHIKNNGVAVEVGQVVVRGETIAESGNTGRSSGPHLHYQVQQNNANWGQTIRIRFDTQSHGGCYIPQTGDAVTSNNTH